MNVAYMRGTQLGMARHGDNAFEIVRILVVGIETGDGLRAVRPAAYFSLIGVKEYAGLIRATRDFFRRLHASR
jgi:hypothetical protein